MAIGDGQYGPACSSEKITVDNTIKTLTAAKYSNLSLGGVDARSAYITIEGTAGTNDIRVTFDGTDPVASTTGHLLKASTDLVVYGYQNLAGMKFTREGGSSGTIQVTYFR